MRVRKYFIFNYLYEYSGGEGGIRTPDTRRYTRFRVVRDRPDSATSPTPERNLPLTIGDFRAGAKTGMAADLFF